MKVPKYNSFSYHLQPVFALKEACSKRFVCYYDVTKKLILFDKKEYSLLHFHTAKYMRILASTLSTFSGLRIINVRIGFIPKFNSILSDVSYER